MPCDLGYMIGSSSGMEMECGVLCYFDIGRTGQANDRSVSLSVALVFCGAIIIGAKAIAVPRERPT